jgi:hypothetical protein
VPYLATLALCVEAASLGQEAGQRSHFRDEPGAVILVRDIERDRSGPRVASTAAELYSPFGFSYRHPRVVAGKPVEEASADDGQDARRVEAEKVNSRFPVTAARCPV